MSDDVRSTTVHVPDVCCAAEESVLRKAFERSQDVRKISFDLTRRLVRVEHQTDAAQILAVIRRAGFNGRVTDQSHAEPHHRSKANLAGVIASGALLLSGLALSALDVDESVSVALFLLSMIAGGVETGPRAFRALRALRLDVNILMTVAAIGAVILGQFAEAATVLCLYAVSLLIESASIDRTRRAIAGLLALSPPVVRIRTDAAEVMRAVADVRPGETMVIKPGERIPLDGVVLQGGTSVDEAALTGESLPRYKTVDAEVYAGSMNGNGTLDVRVTASSEHTVLHRIADMVESARSQKNELQTTIEKLTRWYVPSVFVLGIVVAVFPPLFAWSTWSEAAYRALSLLVISCPCALLLSVPVAVVSAITGAARHGLLIRDGKVLERLSSVRAVALDKTGTLTQGLHVVTKTIPMDGLDENGVIAIVAALESRSEHPLAGAVLREADRRGLGTIPFVDGFESIPGRGVRGSVGGSAYIVGNPELIAEHGLSSELARAEVESARTRGETVLLLADRSRTIGVICLSDVARAEAASIVEAMRELMRGPVVLLTGDNESVGNAMGTRLGVTEVRSQLLPHQKVEEIQILREKHGAVAMVGDGINDAPALASADVGIAMGSSASGVAIEASDVVLLGGTLHHLPSLFRLGRMAHRIIVFNIALALLTKALFLVLGAAGYSSLWLAILADDGVTLVVLLNCLRLLAFPASDPVQH